MRNEEIHDKLDKKEIRNFLSKELIIAEFRAFSTVDFYEEQIKELNESLVEAKKRDAINLLVEEQGWETFDISDEIGYKKDSYFNFIGTKKEYQQLMNDINNEK